MWELCKHVYILSNTQRQQQRVGVKITCKFKE